jgi:hypothetical protein
MIWTRKTVALTALGTVLGFGVLGGGAAYAMTSGHSQAAAQSAPSATKIIYKTVRPKATPAPVPTKTVTVTPSASQAPAPAQTPAWRQPSSAPAQPQFTNGSAVVAQYYQDITDHNYSAAWAMGGSNVSGGVGYDAWVAGYDTTASITMYNSSNWDSGEVTTYLSAVQTDGTTRTYYGTYYVTNGVITSASIAQTS